MRYFWLVWIFSLVLSVTFLYGAVPPNDNTPCSIEDRPDVTAETALAHAGRVRAMATTESDGNRLMCWLYIAADKNIAKAQVQLGFLSLIYDKSERHNDDAADWFQRAAGQFDLIGQVMASQMFRDGVGVVQKPNLQALWMDKALAQASQLSQLSSQTKQQQSEFLVKLARTARAASELPVTKDTEYFGKSDLLTKQIICSEGFDRYCVSGIKINNDWKKGVSQAGKVGGCSADNPDHINGHDAWERGEILSQGVHTIDDQLSQESVCWYFVGAGQGYAGAEERLGKLYYGSTVENHYEHAAYWYEQAANHGDAAGAIALAGMYAKGLGVKQSSAEARKWQSKQMQLAQTAFKKRQDEAVAKSAGSPPKVPTIEQQQRQDAVATLMIMLFLASHDDGGSKTKDDDPSAKIQKLEGMCSAHDESACYAIGRNPPN